MDYLNDFCEVIYLPRTEGVSSNMLRENMEKYNIAIFGDCIPKGTVSLIENGEVVVRRFGDSIIKKMSKICNIDDFAQANAAVTYCGCRKPPKSPSVDTKISVVYKILNNKLDKYDAIIIFCSVNDIRNKVKIGTKEEENVNTLHGAYNLIFKELKLKYSSKKVIFVLPPYCLKSQVYDEKCENISVKKVVSTIKNMIIENGYTYISFYDFLKEKFENFNPKQMFPDGYHPSNDIKSVMIDYIVHEIIKNIEKQ